MASTNYVDNSLPAISAAWLNDVDAYVYSNITTKPIYVTDPLYGAVGNGVTDDTSAIDAASAAALSAGVPLVFPEGSYLYSGTVYVVDAHAQVINRGYGATNETLQARNAALTLNVAPPATSPQASASTRYAMVINGETEGEQNLICLRVNVQNESTGVGSTATGIYGHAVSISTADWTAALHGETRHGGGASLAMSSESASYSTAGTFYGLVVNNTTATAGATHPITGDPFVAHPSATGILIQGGNNTDTAGGWVYGIKVDTNSMRVGGIGMLFDCSAVVECFIKTAASTESSVADIYLQGDSSYGIILNGTYTNGAMRIADDQYIALRTNGAVKMRYDISSSEFEVVNGSSERFSVSLGANPAIGLNDVQVVQERITGWSAATGAKSKATFVTSTASTADIGARLGQLIDDLMSHGLIGA